MKPLFWWESFNIFRTASTAFWSFLSPARWVPTLSTPLGDAGLERGASSNIRCCYFANQCSMANSGSFWSSEMGFGRGNPLPIWIFGNTFLFKQCCLRMFPKLCNDLCGRLPLGSFTVYWILWNGNSRMFHEAQNYRLLQLATDLSSRSFFFAQITVIFLIGPLNILSLQLGYSTVPEWICKTAGGNVWEMRIVSLPSCVYWAEMNRVSYRDKNAADYIQQVSLNLASQLSYQSCHASAPFCFFA